MIFQIKIASDGQFFFNLCAEEKILLKSELYKQKASCHKGIASVRTNAENPARYELKVASNGKHFCNLKASNGQVIATSALCSDAAALQALISACQKGAATAAEEEV